MSDIPHNLRAGTGSPAYIEQQDIDDVTKRLISMVVVMTKQASELAYKVAIHGNKTAVDGEDVNSALKYQARHFLQTLDDPQIVTDVMTMERDLFGEDDLPEDDEDDLPDEDTVRASAVMSGNTCVCDMCATIRQAVDTWDDWNPDDQAELFLRHSVERAIENYEAHKEDV